MSSEAVLHDPGGKVTLALRPGIRGDAVFSKCGRFRHLLTRCWAADPALTAFDVPYVLWIGVNPSTASGDADVPTVRREVDRTMSLGFEGYVKANVLDYRATSPKDLLSGPFPRSEMCLPAIRDAAARARMVVMACGVLHRELLWAYDSTVEALLADGRVLHCLGTTKDGYPRHPLYLSAATPLVRFDPG